LKFVTPDQFEQGCIAIDSSIAKQLAELKSKLEAAAESQQRSISGLRTIVVLGILVLAGDHVIRDETAFTAAVQSACAYAEAGKLVTFGIVPTSAETGYGYIKRGVATGANQAAYTVAQFVEKPDQRTAEHYLESGDYYWNSGMFLFRASRYLTELELFRPDIYAACVEAVGTVNADLDFVRVNKAAFLCCPSDSIDYAVMERTADAVVVPMSAGWSDVGSWSSLWEISEKDINGNVSHGEWIAGGLHSPPNGRYALYRLCHEKPSNPQTLPDRSANKWQPCA
jgi:mannose-1-phosphate guanylyltransferase/mannose-6-phosphate isomerase